ncbi:MAG: tRNA (adenosine(37)-N6)-threonylcarbamoyltransferase complex dimerization subunit type 1 TsaB [Anaerolineae bacterium]
MILAIDTATRIVSIALHDGSHILAESTWRSAGHHTVEVAPALQHMLERAQVAPADLAAIAVPRGPGSYTGLRIGMSLAKGLALASSPPLPLIAVPTLDITAYAQPPLRPYLCAVAQAGRRRINAGFYRHAGDRWAPQGESFIATWQDLIPRLSEPVLVAGEIDAQGAELLSALGDHVLAAPERQGLRRASSLAEIACHRLRVGQLDDTPSLAPIYLS